MACALFAATSPEPPAARPFDTAASKSPWWKRRHASCAAASFGNSSRSPLWSLSHAFFSASPLYSNAFAAWGKDVHFDLAIVASLLDVLAPQRVQVASRLAAQVGRDEREHL